MNRRLFAAALELVLIVGRHGVRSPLETPAELAPFAAQPWPSWSVPTGHLTAHGAEGERQLGHYFHDRYVAAGLLSGQAPLDARCITLRADKDQRTIESARLLGDELAPGQPMTVLARTGPAADALFSGAKVFASPVDKRGLVDAVRGRLGNDPQALLDAYRPLFDRMQAVLFPGGRIPPGKIRLSDLPVLIESGSDYDAVHMSGPFMMGMRIAEAFELEYCEGWDPARVGWGRVDAGLLNELMMLHPLYFNLTQKTFACAQINVSNLARHLQETLEQAATGRPVRGAIGPPGQKIVVVLGHDTNLINLAGLLNLDWILPGTQPDPLLPGGALVFELRRDDAGRQWLRLEYVAATLAQQHRGDRLDLAHPPAEAPIYIPDCSGRGPAYEAPLPAVERKLNQVIAPRFVDAGSA